MKVSAPTLCSAVSDLCLLVFVYLTGRLQIVNRFKLTENPKRIKSENVKIKMGEKCSSLPLKLMKINVNFVFAHFVQCRMIFQI